MCYNLFCGPGYGPGLPGLMFHGCLTRMCNLPLVINGWNDVCVCLCMCELAVYSQMFFKELKRREKNSSLNLHLILLSVLHFVCWI